MLVIHTPLFSILYFYCHFFIFALRVYEKSINRKKNLHRNLHLEIFNPSFFRVDTTYCNLTAGNKIQ